MNVENFIGNLKNVNTSCVDSGPSPKETLKSGLINQNGQKSQF